VVRKRLCRNAFRPKGVAVRLLPENDEGGDASISEKRSTLGDVQRAICEK